MVCPANEERIKELEIEFAMWKSKTDKYLDVSHIPLKYKPNGWRGKKELQKWEDNLYVIKENNDIYLSAGTMLWLYLGGSSQNYDDVLQYKRDKNYKNYIESLKIHHRLELFKINTEDFDFDKIKKALGDKKQ